MAKATAAAVEETLVDDGTPVLAGVHAKMLWIMEQVGRIPKNGYNSFHKYKYVKEDDLSEAVRKLFIEVGVFPSVSVKEVIQNGTLTTILTEHTFTDVDTGQQIVVSFAGAGDDKGDKGIYKAMTGDTKYMLMKMFLIPTGDEPEADIGTDARNEAKPTGTATQTRSRVASTAPTNGGISAKFLGIKQGVSTKTGNGYFYMEFDIGSNKPFKHLFTNDTFASLANTLALADDARPDQIYLPDEAVPCTLWLDTTGAYPKLEKVERTF